MDWFGFRLAIVSKDCPRADYEHRIIIYKISAIKIHNCAINKKLICVKIKQKIISSFSCSPQGTSPTSRQGLTSCMHTAHFPSHSRLLPRHTHPWRSRKLAYCLPKDWVGSARSLGNSITWVVDTRLLASRFIHCCARPLTFSVIRGRSLRIARPVFGCHKETCMIDS